MTIPSAVRYTQRQGAGHEIAFLYRSHIQPFRRILPFQTASDAPSAPARPA